jgi:hypothetical protein
MIAIGGRRLVRAALSRAWTPTVRHPYAPACGGATSPAPVRSRRLPWRSSPGRASARRRPPCRRWSPCQSRRRPRPGPRLRGPWERFRRRRRNRASMWRSARASAIRRVRGAGRAPAEGRPDAASRCNVRGAGRAPAEGRPDAASRRSTRGAGRTPAAGRPDAASRRSTRRADRSGDGRRHREHRTSGMCRAQRGHPRGAYLRLRPRCDPRRRPPRRRRLHRSSRRSLASTELHLSGRGSGQPWQSPRSRTWVGSGRKRPLYGRSLPDPSGSRAKRVSRAKPSALARDAQGPAPRPTHPPSVIAVRKRRHPSAPAEPSHALSHSRAPRPPR